MMHKLVVLAFGAVLLTSCGKVLSKDKDTPYQSSPNKSVVGLPSPDCPQCNDGVDIPANPTPAPVPAPNVEPDHPTNFCNKRLNGASYSETTTTSQGSRSGYDFGYGGGCLHRPIREVMAVALNRPLMVWDEVDESSFLEYSPPDHVNYFYSVTYKVHSVINVSWIMDWYYSMQRGSVSQPQEMLINYKKTKGTTHIQYWEGSIYLNRVNDDVTSFVMLNQIQADQNTPQDAEDAVKDVFRKLHTGTPDWDKLK